MAMRDIFLQIRLFEDTSERCRKRSRLQLLIALEALVHHNQIWLRYDPSLPLLFESGVRYEPEFGREEWADIPTVLAKGYADCEDLACWRVAELRERYGVRAKVNIDEMVKKNGGLLFHVRVEYPPQVKAETVNLEDDFFGNQGAYRVSKTPGPIEDPSRRLGMDDWQKYGCSEACEIARPDPRYRDLFRRPKP